MEYLEYLWAKVLWGLLPLLTPWADLGPEGQHLLPTPGPGGA